jgi:pilus assembly protein Flp/PilA
MQSLADGQKQKGVGMRGLLVKFLNDDSGATAIEYGLIAACIAVAIIAILQSLGSALVASLQLLIPALK